MPELGLKQIDASVQTFNTWLNQIADALGGGKADAYHALRAGLFALRDRMVADEAVDLSQQLPLIVRGIWFEGWQPHDVPRLDRDRDAWLATMEGRLRQEEAGAIDPERAATAVMAVLKAHLDVGQVRHLESQLPAEIADMLRAA